METAIRYLITADTGQAGSALTALAGKFGGFKTKAVAAAAGASAAFLKVGNDFDNARATIVRGTGASGKALDDMLASAQNLRKYGIVPASGAIADLNTLLGVSGPDLERLAEKTLMAQQAFGAFDVAALGRAFNAMGTSIDDAEFAIDALGTTAQASGISMGELISQVQTHGGTFATFGLDIDEAASFIGDFHKAGLDVGPIISGLKLGMSKLADEGADDLTAALGGVITKMNDAESDTELLSIATEYFTSRAAAPMVSAIREGLLPNLDNFEIALEDVQGATEASFEGTQTLQTRFGQLKDSVIGVVGEYGHLLGGMSSLAGGLIPLAANLSLATVKTALLTAGTKLMRAAQIALNFALNLNPIGLIITAVALAATAYVTWRDEINRFLQRAWNLFITAMQRGLTMVNLLISTFPDLAAKIGIDGPINLDRFRFAVEDADDAAGDLAETIAGDGNSVTGAAASCAGALTGSASGTGSGGAAGALKKTAEKAFDLNSVSGDLEITIGDLVDGFGGLTPATDRQAGAYEKLYWQSLGYKTAEEEAAEAAAETEAEFEKLYWASLGYTGELEKQTTQTGLLVGGLEQVPPAAAEVEEHLKSLGPSLGEQLMAGLGEKFSPANVSATISRAFEQGTGWRAAARSLGAQAGGVIAENLNNKLQGWAQGVAGQAGAWGNIVGAAMSGGITAAINLGIQGLSKLGGWIKGLFGGVSEEALGEKADFAAIANEKVGGTASSQERLTDLISSGWADADARLFTFFQDQALMSQRWEGDTAGALAAAEGEWHRYHDAMRTGDTKTMEEIERNVLGWTATNEGAAEDNEEAWASSFTAQTVESDTLTDKAIANSLRLRDAMIQHSKDILAATRTMADGIKAALTSIPDRKIQITYEHSGAAVGGAGTPSPAPAGGTAGSPIQIVVQPAPVNLDGRAIYRSGVRHAGHENHLSGARA